MRTGLSLVALAVISGVALGCSDDNKTTLIDTGVSDTHRVDSGADASSDASRDSGPRNDATGDVTPMLDVGPMHSAKILWHYGMANGQGGIRNSVAVANSGQHIWTGGYSAGAMLFKTVGDGKPLWTSCGVGAAVVAAAKTRDILYAACLAVDPANPSGPAVFTVNKFTSASATPEWTYDGTAAGYEWTAIAHEGNVVATPDGEVLAVTATPKDGLAILFFKAGSSTPFSVFKDATMTAAQEIRISSDGKTCILHESEHLHRIDVATAKLEGSVDVVGGSHGLAISGDASVVAHGFQYLTIFEWSSGKFKELWKRTYPNDTAYKVAMTGDGETIVVALRPDDTDNIGIERFKRSLGSKPVWSYATPKSPGKHQDEPGGIAISSNAEYILTGSWGNDTNKNPELLLMQDSNPAKPFFTLDTPGSIFGVDISPDGKYAATVGKAIHANPPGNGYDIYAIEITP